LFPCECNHTVGQPITNCVWKFSITVDCRLLQRIVQYREIPRFPPALQVTLTRWFPRQRRG